MKSNTLSYSLAGLDRFKTFKKVTGSGYDDYYRYLLVMATDFIEHECSRKFRAREYTEYYNGKGSHELYLKNFPVISTESTIEIWDDLDRGYGDTYKLESTDIVIYPDEGIVEILGSTASTGSFQNGQRNVKVTYKAGYSKFEIITGYNDAIDFNEGASEFNATLDSGVYTAADLATEIDTQLTAEGAGTYTVAYNAVTMKFTIVKSAGTFQLLWNTGANAANNAGDLLGYAVSADDTGALTYTSDYERSGVPGDLEMACMILAQMIDLQTPKGDSRLGLKSRHNVTQMSNISYDLNSVPDFVMRVIRNYRKFNV